MMEKNSWKNRVLELAKKALENKKFFEGKEFTKEEKEKQIEALKGYIAKFEYDDEPSEFKSFLGALEQRVANYGYKRRQLNRIEAEYSLMGMAYGIIITKDKDGHYTKDEWNVISNMYDFWKYNNPKEEIFLENVIVYGEG